MLDKIAGLFSSKDQEIPDLIEALGLSEWYMDLSVEEQQKLYENSYALGLGGEFNLLDQTVQSTSETQQNYLRGVGSSAVSNKDYEFAEKILLKALDTEETNPTDRHFIYNSLIKLYYKQRDDREDAIENCVEYCKRDINSIEDFLNAWGKEYDDGPPRIPSFKRLAIIYEKQGNYQDALEICDQAIQLGLDDGTKGGFEGRKNRIQSKIDD